MKQKYFALVLLFIFCLQRGSILASGVNDGGEKKLVSRGIPIPSLREAREQSGDAHNFTLPILVLHFIHPLRREEKKVFKTIEIFSSRAL